VKGKRKFEKGFVQKKTRSATCAVFPQKLFTQITPRNLGKLTGFKAFI